MLLVIKDAYIKTISKVTKIKGRWWLNQKPSYCYISITMSSKLLVVRSKNKLWLITWQSLPNKIKFSLGGMTKFSLTTKLKRNIQEGYLCKESKDTIFIRTLQKIQQQYSEQSFLEVILDKSLMLLKH